MKRFCLSLIVAALLPVVASADVSQTGPGATFVDNANSSSSIFVTANEIVSDVFIDINDLNHTWVGDLQATLTHVDTGSSVSIFDGIGSVGNTGAGDSSNFNDSYNFGNGFPGDIWAAAAAGGNGDDIAGGPYFATDINGGLVDMGGAFAGESTVGEWRLDIFDRANGDTGGYGSWGIRIISNPVPEPGSLAVVGLIALGGLIRRRR